MTVTFRPGRLPHDPRPARLALADYRTRDFIAPTVADWTTKIRSWPMLANDHIGDCTCAGAGHIAQQVNWYGRDLDQPVSDSDALTMYQAISGYRPGQPDTDVGATLQDALGYWRKTGIGGNRIAAFAQVKASDVDTVRACIAAFGSVYCGMWFPQSAENQFNARQPWTVVKHSPNLGGHCVPITGYDQAGFTCITWGRPQRMTVDFYLTQFDEVWVPADLDWAGFAGQSPAGLETSALNADFAALTGQPGPFPAAPQPAPLPADPDRVFAKQLHTWLDTRPHTNQRLQGYASDWLVAKGL